MGKHFSVRSRKDCKWCGGPLPTNRHRVYCSEKCRNNTYAKKYYWQNHTKRLASARAKRGKRAPGKKKCLVCGRWYFKVGSHAVWYHKFTSARHYRERYNLPVKRGIVSATKRKEYGDNAIKNGSANNVKKGKKYWYKKGDARAKEKNLFYKGRKREPDEYYE